MRWFTLGIGVLLMVLEAGCGGAEWMHPTKPKEAFAVDYNKCQNDVLRDPKLQQGLQILILQATERCVQKMGWVLVEQ
jgi:hypothetical protein